MREYHAGYRDAGFLFGSGVATALPWILGTLGGHLLGQRRAASGARWVWTSCWWRSRPPSA